MAMAGDEHNQTLKAAHGDGTEQDLLAGLPDDLVADILHRVPPRWLAASRCVCKAWHDAIDRSRILRADLLPLSLAGLFVHFEYHKYPEYLARPSSTAGTRGVSGDLSFLPSASPDCGSIWHKGVDFYDYHIKNYCNGLLLLTGNYVVNPATRRWCTLPTCPSEHHRKGVWYEYDKHLVYDPMLSPHYEVFSIPTFKEGDEVDPSMEGCEWPPSLCKIYVFSSKSGRWEEKDFKREGNAAGTVAEMRAGYNELRSVYFQGALYVHCGENFITRVSLSSNTYSVIKPPMDLKDECDIDAATSISRSKSGVHFLALYKCLIQVWILHESSGQMEWMLKHAKSLPRHWINQRAHTPWIFEDVNYNLFGSSHCPDDNNKPPTREIFEWNSDDDNGLENENMAEDCDSEDNEDCYHLNVNGDIHILGFHPYKEIVFLSESARTCLAYHLNTSKVEVLGSIYPKEYYFFKDFNNELDRITSFPNTPCWIEEF